MTQIASYLNVLSLNKFVIGVGWLYYDATCMYVIMFLSKIYESSCMYVLTQAFYHHF